MAHSYLTFYSRGFKIPITVMLDLSALRKQVPVITVEEFLALHGRNTSIEVGNGGWAYELYQGANYDAFRIPNEPGHPDELFEPPNTIRVDRLPTMPRPMVPTERKARFIYDQLRLNSTSDGILTPKMARELLTTLKVKLPEESTDEGETLAPIMTKYGFGLLHTYLSR